MCVLGRWGEFPFVVSYYELDHLHDYNCNFTHLHIHREFYYIQMEKYSRQLLSEGVVNADDIHVSPDSELFRALNLHYNRNNHIEVRIAAC